MPFFLSLSTASAGRPTLSSNSTYTSRQTRLKPSRKGRHSKPHVPFSFTERRNPRSQISFSRARSPPSLQYTAAASVLHPPAAASDLHPAFSASSVLHPATTASVLQSDAAAASCCHLHSPTDRARVPPRHPRLLPPSSEIPSFVLLPVTRQEHRPVSSNNFGSWSDTLFSRHNIRNSDKILHCCSQVCYLFDDSMARAREFDYQQYMQSRIPWCKEDGWPKLCRYWTSKAYKTSRERGQKSRLSSTDVAVATTVQPSPRKCKNASIHILHWLKRSIQMIRRNDNWMAKEQLRPSNEGNAQIGCTNEMLQQKQEMHVQLIITLSKEIGKELPTNILGQLIGVQQGTTTPLMLDPNRLMATPMAETLARTMMQTIPMRTSVMMPMEAHMAQTT